MAGGRNISVGTETPDEKREREAREQDRRLKEQKAEAQKIGEYWSEKLGWPKWRKKFDLDSDEAKNLESDAHLSLGGSNEWKKLEPGIYEQVGVTDEKLKFDIRYDGQSVSAVPPIKDKPGTPEYKEKYRKMMLFIAANLGTDTIEIDLKNPKGDYDTNLKHIKALMEIAQEEGLTISFGKDGSNTNQFLDRIEDETTRTALDTFAKDLKVNRLVNDMRMGLDDTAALDKKSDLLDEHDNVEDLIAAGQPVTPAAMQQAYIDDLYTQRNPDGTPVAPVAQLATDSEKSDAVDHELDHIEERLEEDKYLVKGMAESFEAQDKLLNDSEALRNALNFKFEKQGSWKLPKQLYFASKYGESAEGKSKEYEGSEGRGKVVEDIAARTTGSETQRQAVVDKLYRDLNDLERRKEFLMADLNSKKAAFTAANNPELDRVTKQITRLEKIEKSLQEEIKKDPAGNLTEGNFKKIKDKHDARSGANAQAFFDAAQQKAEAQKPKPGRPTRA